MSKRMDQPDSSPKPLKNGTNNVNIYESINRQKEGKEQLEKQCKQNI